MPRKMGIGDVIVAAEDLADRTGRPVILGGEPKRPTTTITLPGNSTLSDFTQTLEIAAQIIENPDQFDATTRQGIALAVRNFANVGG